MSKRNPAKNDSAEQTDGEPTVTGNQATEDPALDELADARDEALRDGVETLGNEESESERIDRLRTELEEAKDRELRSRAELENYRKRSARQMTEERRYADMPLIRDLLPIWDNMGRAIEAVEKTHDTASLLEGFKMVAGQLEDVLKRHHCTRIEALGEPFDPNRHEAISQQPSDEHPPNTVTHVAQIGFQLHDRVVRPPQVIVSTVVAEQADNQSQYDTAEE